MQEQEGNLKWLLVVTLVLLVLFGLSLLIGVGGGPSADSEKQGTELIQTNLGCALQEYHKITGGYPPDRADPNGRPNAAAAYVPETARRLLWEHLCGRGAGEQAPKVCEATRPYMAKMDEQLRDAWRKPMRYYLLGGQKPIVVSAGRDGDFGDDKDDVKARKDNIRSDGRGTWE